MVPLKLRPDPISSRERELNRKLADVEAQIRKLSRSLEADRPEVCKPLPDLPRHVRKNLTRPVFEEMERPSPTPSEPDNTAEHYNDLGVRKYDLVAAWKRLRHHLAGPESHNQKLVSFLAAGSIQGLRPLRYEKRVARNRFLFTSLFFLAVLYGIISVYLGS